MKAHFLYFLLIINAITLAAQDSKLTHQTEPLSIGEKVTLRSNILKENRVLNIYLPHGYDATGNTSYPVIYLLDGSIDEDFIHISGLVQFGSFSWINILPQSIVVGISNVDRKKDFTWPSKSKLDQDEFPTSGHSTPFINFIDKEVQPYIDNNYNTSKTKTLIGQSLGGLLASEILFKNPDMFDNYVIISPSLWWDDQSLYNDTPKSYTGQKSIYIAVGNEGARAKEAMQRFYDKLVALNTGNTKLYFKFFEKQDHGDVLHLAVYDAFEKIFKKEDQKK